MSFTNLSSKLEKLSSQNLLRSLKLVESPQGRTLTHKDKTYLNFSSNNYLGLAEHPQVQAAFIQGVEKYGVGSGASRLITGSSKPFHQLEEVLAEFKSTEAALVFNSGYHANTGVLSCLTEEGDVIFSDELNHASLIDGMRLSKAKRVVYAHNNLEELREKIQQAKKQAAANTKLFIVTESVFSMDGDLCDLKSLLEIAVEYDALLYLDEAHATGVLGETGSGLAETVRDHPGFKTHLIQMGTLGKALGCFGAYVAGPQVLIDYLINRSRTFIYTTALPPAVAVAALEAIKLVKDGKLRQELWDNIKFLNSKFESTSDWRLATGDFVSPIIPLIIGEAQTTLKLSQKLWDQGLWVTAIRPPTVPENTSRLRITLMATHTKQDIEKLLYAISPFWH